MADLRPEQYSTNTLFVSPDNLMLHHDLAHFEAKGQDKAHMQSASHHRRTIKPCQAQSRPTPPLYNTSLSEWNSPPHMSFRADLPPTPAIPLRPLPPRPLSEDEKSVFPCTRNYSDCWNTELCPKHRPDMKHEQQPMNGDTTTVTPLELFQQSPPGPNPRRRSAPVGGVDPRPAKMKRNTTEPGEADPDVSLRYHQHTTIDGDARSSLSKGRVPHNMVERRYRDNLNNQIEALRLTLPSLRDAQPCTAADSEGHSSPRMPSKAVIISTAATYIKDIENERTRLLAANTALQEQVSSLQKLMRCDDCDVLQCLNTVRLNHAHLRMPS